MNRKGFALIGLLAVTAILAIAVVFFLQGRETTPEITPTTRQPTETVVAPTTTDVTGACRPNMEFTTFSDPAFGYSIEYPKEWFIESYDPGEKQYGSGNNPPYLMLAMATIDENFSPQATAEEEVARVFLSRGPKDPSFNPATYPEELQENYDEFGLDVTVEGRLITLSGYDGVSLNVSGTNDAWTNSTILLQTGDFLYNLKGSARIGDSEQNCLNIISRILNSFTLTK